MRTILTAIIVCGLLGLAALAQDAPPSSTNPNAPQAQPSTPPTANPEAQAQSPAARQASSNPAGNPLRIAPGSVIPVQLAKTIDAKKMKTGDEVTATVTQDMKTNSGEVLVPKDTKILGHITEAQARNKEQKESQVGITFDHAVVKGDPMQLPMSIQAIIAPPSNNPGAPGNDQGGGAPAASAPSSSMGGARAGGMGGGSNSGSSPQAQAPNYSPTTGASDQAQPNARPQITGSTQGVIGMPDVKLETAAQNNPQGSVVSSEKNNVKLEKGTMMLLKVQ